MSIKTNDRSLDKTLKQLRKDMETVFLRLELAEKKYELIRELDNAIMGTPSSSQNALNLIIERGLDLTGSQHGQVVVYRRGRLIIEASSDPDLIGEEITSKDSPCWHALNTKERVKNNL